MKTIKKQRGVSFLSWVSILSILILAFVTGVKLVPVYIEFYSVQSIMQKIAADPSISATNTQSLRGKLDDYLNINGMYTVQREYFSVQPIPENKNAKALVVDYEVRKPWLGNISFLLSFHHTVELKGQ
ncbi:MAG TPA: DUF4845 domain-containing protein [Thiolinea sp.]|nr:DUF4845 domain-containing protein [Thiolinea sp.]